ncbi:MAG TPA: DUF6249 domain-containing protein, partial [Candidatus Dormibacteraeota bacterium]|nr:DUF6249 domain-containing protein [Candidatus Dormibacteraeota bacterium]
MSDNAVGALAIFCIFGLPIVAIMVHRILKHQERVAMIQHGFPVDLDPVDLDPRQAYRAMRAARKMGMPPPMPGESAHLYYANARLQRGVRTTFIGLAILVGVLMMSIHHGRVVEPGGWLFFGLIPLFVGLSQITGAMLSGAQLGGLSSGQSWSVAPPPQAPGAPGP